MIPGDQFLKSFLAFVLAVNQDFGQDRGTVARRGKNNVFLNQHIHFVGNESFSSLMTVRLFFFVKK